MNKFCYRVKVNKFLIVFFLLVSVSVLGGKLKRGYEALKIYDYFKAKQLFEKALKSNTCGASYGLSSIYSLNNNPFYNLDSSLIYIKKSIKSWNDTPLNKKEKLKEFGVDSLSILKLKNSINQKCFIRAKEINTVVAYNYYLENNTVSFFDKQAIHLRDSLAYYSAKQINTSEAYLSYINAYPNAVYYAEAKSRYDRQLYNEYAQKKSILANEDFIRTYPQNPFTERAEENIYELFTNDKTEQSYKLFIKKYPKSSYVNMAWRKIYSLHTKVYTPQNIKHFLNKYPNYPFKEELEKDYSLANEIFVPIKENNLWGYKDTLNQWRINPTYDWVSDFSEGVAAVQKNDKTGYINKLGEIVIPCAFDEAEKFVKGLAIVGQNDQYGVIDKTGNYILPLNYNDIGDISKEYIAVNINDAYGFVDKKGELKVGLLYESVGDFVNGYAFVKQNGLFGIIDTNLFYVIKPKYQWIDKLNNLNFIRIKYNGKFGVINIKGNYIVEPIYTHISELSNGYAIVVQNNKYGYINAKGKLTIPLKFDYTDGVLNWALFNQNKYAKVMIESSYGMIDTLGERFMPALFQSIGEMSDKLIAIKRNDYWGYCDYNTKLKIPYKYAYAYAFINGEAIVKTKDNLFGLINESGQEVLAPIYTSLKYIASHAIYIAEKDNLYGIINAKGVEIVPFKYDNIALHQTGLLLLTHNNTTDIKPIRSRIENE